jgi:formamidopyrimidine-DNA glycosylase
MSTDFNYKYLSDRCAAKKMPIKNLLLDQSIVAGIGNIYAIEILFATRISPKRPANSLSIAEVQKIYKQTIKTLELAIKHNGTSISDFRRVDDKTGEFQQFLQIYGKAICPICDSKLIRIKQGGRSTVYCGSCQI